MKNKQMKKCLFINTILELTQMKMNWLENM